MTYNSNIKSLNRRHLLRTGLAGSLAASLAPLLHAQDKYPLATTRSGKIRGVTEHNVHVFRGVPYGADTSTRRFMPAVQEEKWTGTRDAFYFGAAAPQRNTREPVSEDCLYLNVWTPGLRDGARRPILFYIHGGGYNNGSGADPQYDGINLCLRGDVVVITVNHRLNAFGYLYLAQLGGKEFAHSGNVGQLDLVQALQWVKQHALEFGGDPDNVTVFGQSGGGAKIITLMAMPAASNLFQRAFTMSGQQVTAAGPRAATQRAEIFLDALQLPREKIARIQSLPLEKILEATQAKDPSRVENNRLYFGPVLDNQVLLRHPFYPDAPAQSRHIPLVIGNTKDETRAFLGGDPDNFKLTWEQLPQKLIEQQYVDLNAEIVIAEYRRLYPKYSPSDVFFAATTAGRSWRGAIIQAEERARQGAPAYVYQLDWASPLDGGKFGAFHTLDIPLVFDNIVQPGSRTGTSKAAQTVADQMSEALLAFARTGNPSHKGIPDWKPYTLDKRETLVFNEKSALAFDPRGDERKLYARVPFIQRGTF
jgi:para-nitrobenzyl esterase